MKVYFNTKTFDRLIAGSKLEVTDIPEEATLLVLGAKGVDYSQFMNLQAVYRFGMGSDNVDFEYLKERAISINFPTEKAKEILYDATANYTAYGILNLLYQGAFGDVDTWKKKQRDYITKKVAFVIGLGNIGQRVADKIKSFMKVTTFDIRYNRPEELKALIQAADVITIHISLNDDTRYFFDAEKLSWIKDDAIIVNTARGHLFDEDALFEKLKMSNCKAFFDVFWKEPYNGKLKKLGKHKFFMSPHSASNTKEFIQEGFNDVINLAKELEQCRI